MAASFGLRDREICLDLVCLIEIIWQSGALYCRPDQSSGLRSWYQREEGKSRDQSREEKGRVAIKEDLGVCRDPSSTFVFAVTVNCGQSHHIRICCHKIKCLSLRLCGVASFFLHNWTERKELGKVWNCRWLCFVLTNINKKEYNGLCVAFQLHQDKK